MQNIINTTKDCLVLASKCISKFQQQNLHAGLGLFKHFSESLMHLMEQLAEYNDELQQIGYVVDLNQYVVMLQGMLAAQEADDCILLCDLIELQCIPCLYELQQYVIGNGSELNNLEKWKRNIQLVEQKDSYLARMVKENSDCGYIEIEPASSGHPTLKMTDKTGSYYFHSNVNPVIAGDRFAEQYYTLDCSHYIIYGLGLGYHIKAMLNLDDGLYIDIVETDLNVIAQACKCMELDWLFDNPRVNLIYDADFSSMVKLLEVGKTLLIHQPSMRHIENEEIHLYLEKYFIRDSGIRNFRSLFASNFRDNIENCKHYVDELKENFQGKNIVLVAAGPSLDSNIEFLKQRPSNTLILAVGTVFRKLVQLKIYPDYVVFLDAQKHMYRQLEGLENLDIPIICASSACRKLAAVYKGPKYLVCQAGYDKAEEYAKKKGFCLYETGGSVSTIALDIALRLGCKEVACIGLDLAYTGSKSHTSQTLDEHIADTSEMIKVPACNGGMVATSKLFIIYREWIEHRVLCEDAKDKVINATEGGALIKGVPCNKLKNVFCKWESE
ncbi:MAG: motility associated factor glycosyltransferase family protein [Lachnospiraceae bacterium]